MIPDLDCLGKGGTGNKRDDDDGDDDDYYYDDDDDGNLETPFAVGFNILSQRSSRNN